MMDLRTSRAERDQRGALRVVLLDFTLPTGSLSNGT
jgi:hypothetical protein